MADKPRARFTMENFGPIRSGSFDLRPLTVCIGPNNTGKSYAATMAYAMARALPNRFGHIQVDDASTRLFRGRFRASLTENLEYKGSNLEPDLRQRFESSIERVFYSIPDQISISLLSYFGTKGTIPLRRSASPGPGFFQFLMESMTIRSVCI